MTTKDDPPLSPHRSAFDTVPAPPPFVALPFPGGNAELQKPTRAELVLSAQQWVTRVCEILYDNGVVQSIPGKDDALISRSQEKALLSAFDRLDAVLKELAGISFAL